MDLRFPDAEMAGDEDRGELLVVDVFGNAITAIPGSFVDERIGTTVAVDGERVPVEQSDAHVDPGQRLVTVGSHGNVELAENDGRGSDAFGVRVRDAVRIGG